MKLLYDENLSPRLVKALAASFPQSLHVDGAGLRGRSDEAIWNYAGAQGFAIVSKDNDFRQMSFLYGPPPKVVWLAVGNAGTDGIVQLLKNQREVIEGFCVHPEEGLLVLEI